MGATPPVATFVPVRRTLTETPLARAHDKRLQDHGSRRASPIPWSSFDRTRYSDEALALAYDAQTKLGLGEYTAVDLFARIASALALNGAPFDLVAAATRIPADEIRHADYTLQMAALISGETPTVRWEQRSQASLWSRMSQEDLDLAMMEIPIMSETIAAALLSACAERATDPTVHAVYASILADEVHHLRLGWYYFAWRSPQLSRAERQRLADRAGAMIVEVERTFYKGRDASPKHRKAARSLGVLESKGQREVVRRVMEDDVVPGLDALGFGASHAWKKRKRGGS